MKNVRVRFDYSLTDFIKKANEVIKEAKAESVKIIQACAAAFANGAAKFTPPSIGKNSIEKKYYERPFVVLLRLIRGGYAGMAATEEDKQQFRNGMIYKVLDTRYPNKFRSNVAFGYCKTKGQLKKLCKIETRGLSRVMWGKDLEEIGVKVPVAIQRLLRKSPKLQSLDFNKNKIIENGDTVAVEIENDVARIERYGKMAEKAGYTNAEKALRVQLRLLAEKQKEL
jgi:hypothetical protein